MREKAGEKNPALDNKECFGYNLEKKLSRVPQFNAGRDRETAHRNVYTEG